MPRLSFTKNLERHVACPPRQVDGGTVREVLDAYFECHPQVRGYVLDDQGAVRKHMVLFVNGEQVNDRDRQSDPVKATDEIHVMQALSVADVELRGTVSSADWALMYSAARRGLTKTWAAWFALCIALIAFPLLVDSVTPEPLRWVPGACGLGIFWLAFLQPRFTTRPLAMRYRRVALSDTAIECETEGGYLRFDWARVMRVAKFRSIVVLFLENGSYVPLLRSWSKDDSHWNEVLAALPERKP